MAMPAYRRAEDGHRLSVVELADQFAAEHPDAAVVLIEAFVRRGRPSACPRPRGAEAQLAGALQGVICESQSRSICGRHGRRRRAAPSSRLRRALRRTGQRRWQDEEQKPAARGRPHDTRMIPPGRERQIRLGDE